MSKQKQSYRALIGFQMPGYPPVAASDVIKLTDEQAHSMRNLVVAVEPEKTEQTQRRHEQTNSRRA